jgi:hypothetical protein
VGHALPGVIGKGKQAGREHRHGNAFWARLNQHATDAYGWDRIDLRPEWYISFDQHPWGPFPVHYTMEYYHRFLAELHRVALHDELSADLAKRVDELAAASAARVRAELAWWREEQRRREELAEEAKLPALQRARARWRRRGASVPARPDRRGADRDLLDALRDEVSPETFERIAALPSSADEHVAWLEGYFTPLLEKRFGPSR